MPSKPLLFLSHSGVDTEDARELKRRIEASPAAREVGLTVWFDKDDLEPGRTWQRQLEQVINDRCTAFAVCVGSKGVMNWVESEVSLGLSRATGDNSFPFIPVLAGKGTPSALPPFAALYQAVRDPLNDPAEMEKLLKAILGPRGPVVILEEPFVGLRAMTEADAVRFFGRVAEVDELVKKLERNRLVAVVADSGSGKSSLVLAGLIPKFRGGIFADPARQEPEGRVWHVVTTRPGSAPFDNLCTAVITAAERLGLSPKVKAELGQLIDQSRPQQTAFALQCDLPAETTETLLVVDQFEELFTQTPERLRAPFIDWVLSLIEPKATLKFRVILTIRSDYFNLCSTHPVLFALVSQDNVRFRLKQIAAEGLAEIVRTPLSMAGHKDRGEQDALTAEIRRDVSDRPGDLALVQMALYETWKQHKAKRIGLLEAYMGVGGVSGALAHGAEDVRTNKLDPKQQELLEPVFVRLVNLGDAGGATRRVAKNAEFDDSRGALIKLLSEEKYSRLLLLSAETVDICHEQLITQWPWLQTRITESAAEVRRLSRLIDKANQWNQIEDKTKNQYLATGAELEVFDDLAKRHRGWLSPTEIDYAKTSKDAQQHEERQRSLLFRGVVATSALFAAAALTAGILYKLTREEARVAEEQQRAAQEQAQIANEQKVEAELLRQIAEKQRTGALANESRALTALSRVAFEDDHRPTEAAQLALAAWPREDRDPRPRLEGTLRNLSGALSLGERLYSHQWQHNGAVFGALLTKDGTRILSWSADNTVRLWDVANGQQIGPAMKHDGTVYGALLTKDETRILSWSADNTVRLWDVADGQQIRPAMKHDDDVYGALLSKDETRILSWSADNTLRLWDVATGQQIGPAMKHDGTVYGALLTKDETRILSWSYDKTLRLWDVATGQQIGPAMEHDGAVNGALLTKDETRILSWSYDKTLRLWDVVTGQQIGRAMSHDGRVNGALMTKDETRILSWSYDGTLRLWDVATSKQLGPVMKHGGDVYGAILTRDEARILSWSGTLRVWDVATGQQIGPAMEHDGAVNGALLTKDETRILSWSYDGTLRLWELATGQQIGPAMKHDDAVYGARLMKDEARILSWSADSNLRLWDVATGQQIGAAMKHDGDVYGALLTKDETHILSRSADTLRRWDVATGQQIGPAMKHDDSVNGAVLTKDETRILSWSDDSTVRLWDFATGQQIGPAMKHDRSVRGALLTKDETRILSWSWDNTLRLWDVATGQQIGPAMKHNNFVSGALLTRDETRILSWSGDSTLRLWDVASGQQIGPAMEHDGEVYGALLTKDETRILSWSYDGSLRLWDIATGQQIGPAMGHGGPVWGALLTKDETRILSWCEDKTLRLWDVATGRRIGIMKHDGDVNGARLIRDGTRILSWSADNTLRLWDVATGQQIGPAMKHDDSVNGAVLTKDETRILSWSSDKTLRLWDVATRQQVGPAMKHDSDVNGARLIKDGTRILSWSGSTLRLWDASWPKGNLLEVACALMPIEDRNAGIASKHYRITITDPICEPETATLVPQWSQIERAPK